MPETSTKDDLSGTTQQNSGDQTSSPDHDLDVGDLGLITSRPFDPEPSREKTRSYIALTLVALFATEVLLLIIGVLLGVLDATGLKELAGVIIAPTIALTGAATGFYYGTKPSKG